MRPVQVDVIALVPEGWGLCRTCEALLAQADLDQAPPDRGMEEYPADWLAEHQRLSALVFELADHYGDGVLIRIYDPRSFQGLLKALRHGARRYPTFVVAGRTRVVGFDEEALMQAVEAAMSM